MTGATGSQDEEMEHRQQADRAAFEDLGFSERQLSSAIVTFKTVDRAQRWIDAMGRLALRPEYVYEIALSGLQPEDFVRWRGAGLDAWNALKLPRRLAKAGIGVDDYLRWKSAGVGSGLESLVPHLKADLTFDELLTILADWSEGQNSAADELARMLEGGFKIEQIRRLLESGFSGHEVFKWRESGIPEADWPTWIDLGLDAVDAAEYSTCGVSAATARDWKVTGLSAREVSAFVEKNVPVSTAREWIGARISGTDAVAFIEAGVSLNTAHVWIDAGINAHYAVGFIEKAVALEDALKLDQRGISPWQLTRTEDGLEMDLDPWQEDPADQLPSVIEPGDIDLLLWTSAHDGDPVAHDISFTWDGDHTVKWYEDISIIGDLSPLSSSPIRGVASWPNGNDVLLTYTWNDFPMRGYARLPDMAPTRNDPYGAKDPQQWIRFGEALLNFILLDRGSRQDDGDNLSAEYFDLAQGSLVDLDTVFYRFLSDAGSDGVLPDFNEWLKDAVTAGIYELDDDE